jgi:tetratricopeptide (TPR) repeat protein
VRRSLALFAVAAAVAVAAVVVVAGVNSGAETDAGAATAQTSPDALASGGALPSGHPSIAGGGETTEPAVADHSGDTAVDDDALADLETRRDEQPDDVQTLVDLGDAYFMRQQLEQAEQAYTRALAQDSRNVAAKVGLALVWHARGDSGRAEKSLTGILEAHPDDQDAHYSLAIVYFSAGRVDEAKREWQKAARIDPGTATGRRSQSFVDLLDDDEPTPSAD